jgi:hypothetical protein
LFVYLLMCSFVVHFHIAETISTKLEDGRRPPKGGLRHLKTSVTLSLTQLISQLLPPCDIHWDHDNNGIVTIGS